MKKTLLEIATLINAQLNQAQFNETKVTGVCFDTRQMKQGDLFVPFVGETRDGHSFVREAVKAGAAASFWQMDVPNPPADVPLLLVENTSDAFERFAKKYLAEVAPKVVAITGSNGKTTTKDITRAIMESRYKVHATSGNFNNHIGLPYTILTMPEDTEVAILEMGMNHRNEIEKLTQIACPDIAIITNIGEAHIEYLGSREEIAKAKLEIILGLKQEGLLIYPHEETLIKQNLPKNVQTETFGRNIRRTSTHLLLLRKRKERGSLRIWTQKLLFTCLSLGNTMYSTQWLRYSLRVSSTLIQQQRKPL
ncbi:UDP-N-acetylmuramoyl-tripeptide--D-alanyl-D-alanine ligase [Listeria aquatica]|uniref:UDP-N-acetylmuramoyl-tripeptide--D-alanyl-D- alanine ligase n=1 Tax=Listeria aquatica TaxID=1494960 RepID=UPI0031F5C97D